MTNLLPRFLTFLLFCVLSTGLSFAQGGVCADIEPFCAGDQALIFPNCNNQDPNCTPTAEPGPNYGCLYSQPWPAWFYLQIDQPGRLEFEIIQNTEFDVNGNPVGTGLDVDFIAWGPFQPGDDFCDYSELQPHNEIACSFSAAPIENFTIPNGQTGEIYVLLITNYNQSPGWIKLHQTNAGDPNTGSTDCTILQPPQEGCEGDEFELDATTPRAINYLWEYDDGTGYVEIYNGLFPVITVYDSGDYRATVSFLGTADQTIEFEVNTYPQPVIAAAPIDLFRCDDGGGGVRFDLTENNPIVLGGQDPAFFVSYHHSEDDAINDDDRIPDPDGYFINGTQETICLRIANEDGGMCYAVDSFEISLIIVYATPPPSPHHLCDLDGDGQEPINLVSTFSTTILDGQSPLDVRISYHDNPGDASTGVNPLQQPYLVTSSPETIYARVENRSDRSCFEVVDFQIILDDPPVVNEDPSPLVVCDLDNDGYASFFLHDADDDISLGDPTLIITYHGTLENAQLNVDELSEPYVNDDPWNDVVYARIEDPNTDCYSTVVLSLEVRLTPDLVDPTPLILCEDAQGSGTAVFDLTSKEPEMLDGSDPTDYDFYYYEDQAEAVIAGDLALTAPDFSAAIGSPTTYTNIANPQTVYVLAVGSTTFTSPFNGGEGCYDIVELELIVEDLPVAVQPAPYELCDDLESGSDTDQRSYFDLTSRNSEVTGGNTTLSVTWFETFADEANDIPIADPTAYLNTTTPQTVVARVTNVAGCDFLVTLTLVVNPVPDAAAPTPLVACGGSNGYAQFTLTDKDDEIANGNPGLVISYHGTLDDAQLNRNILSIPHTNTTPWNDVVYARVVDGVTGCLVVVELPLEVRVSPNLATPSPLILCEDAQGSGTAVFDLTSKEAEMLDGTDPAHVDFYYYEDQADAVIAGDLALTNPNYSDAIVNPGAYTNTANPQIVYVLAVGTGDFTAPHNGGEGCYDIVELELIVKEEPVAVQPAPYELCDDVESGSNTDQRSYFDLTSRNSEITGGNTTLTVTWFETFADEANDTPIADPTAYLNTTTPQTVVARVGNAAGCRTLVTLTLIVNPVPDAAAPTPLIACDGGTSGYAQFYLTDKDDEIANGNPGLAISYHGTLDDAQNIRNILAIPYTNTTPWNDVVYARVVDGVTGCLVIVELALEVRLSPNLTTPTPLTYCEDTQGSGTAVFDLTSKEAEMLDGTDPAHIDFYYYEDQADAVIAGDLALTNPNYSDAIVNPGAYTNIANPQIIYVLAVGTGDFTTPPNGGEGCYDIVELELIVEEEPVAVQPAPYELCDDLESGSDTDQTSYFDLTSRNAEITGGNTALTVTWSETFPDDAADNPIFDPTAYLNTATPQTVVARVGSAVDCRALVTLTLIVNPVPNAIAPTPLVVCDADNEGYAYFTLTDKDEEISGGNPNITVSYHETEIDALNGVFPLASPFQNIVAGGQTIYARAFFADPPAGTGCFKVVPLELIVSPTPEMPVELPDLVACDVDGNGFAVFDLTQQDELIYGSQDPTLFDLTYHRTRAEAEQGIGAINNPEAFPNETNPQDIYARLGFSTGDACYVIGKFTLIVAPAIPINDPEPLEVCTPLGEPNTGRAVFDLTVKNTEITGGVAGLGVRYYLTEEDAQSNENWIVPATAFENTENPQRIYVRVIDTNSECAAFTSLLLRVLPNPEPVTPTPIELCDADNSGTAEFDLTLREAEILNGEDWALSYFETYNDAVADENEITDPEQYENIANPQTIYVRVANELSGCFEIVELELIVHPIANVNNEIAPYLLCEFNTTGVATFDLTTKIPEILGDLPPEDYLVTFYLSEEDAANGENPILDPEVHQNRDWNGDIVNPQTIYVGVGIPGTDCYVGKLMDFEILVQEAATATQPAEPFIVCDNLPPSDGIAEFDLEDLNDPAVVALREEILSGQDPDIYSLAFYESLEQAEAGEDPIVFPYLNVVNPQVIYARVTNEDNLYEPRCNSIVEVILKVTEMADIVFDQDEYRLCVDADGNPIEEEFGEMSPPVIDTYLDPNLYTFVWMLNGEVLPGETGSFIVPSAGGVYTVTATDMATGCVASGEVTVWLSSPPIVYDATITKVSAGVFTIEVFADGLGIYEYQLNDGPFQDSATFTNVELGPGAHYVTIRDKNGCGYVILELGIIDYPLYFTPNNDGYHDTWNIHGIGVVDPSATIYIFDRYGKLLKQLSPTGPGWDGTYNGQEMPSTDYWFRADYIENGSRKQLKGHFTLKR